MSILTSMIASTILNSLFSRSKSNRTEPNDFKPLDDKLVTKELPTRLDRTVTPKEQFLGNIGDDVVNESTSMSSLYSSLSDNSKAQVNASYEVYNALEDRMSNMNKRMDVLNENLETVMEGVKSYGQLSSAVSSKGGFLSKVGSGVVNLLKNIGTTLLTIPMLIGSGLSKVANWVFGNGDLNQGDPKKLPENPDIAPDAQEAVAESEEEAESARQGAAESKSNIERLNGEIAELEEKLNEAKKSEQLDVSKKGKPGHIPVLSASDSRILQEQLDKKRDELSSEVFRTKSFGTAESIATNKGERAHGDWQTRSLIEVIPEDDLNYKLEGSYRPVPALKREYTGSNPNVIESRKKWAEKAASKLTDSDIERFNQVLNYVKGSLEMTPEDVVLMTKSKVTERDAAEFLKSDSITRDSSVGVLQTAMYVSQNLPSIATEAKGRAVGVNATTGLNMSTSEQVVNFVNKLFGGKDVTELSKEEIEPLYSIFEDVVNGSVTVKDSVGGKVKPYDFIAEVTYDPSKFNEYSYESRGYPITLQNLLKNVKGSTIMKLADKGNTGMAFAVDTKTGDVTTTSDYDLGGQFDKYSAYEVVTDKLDQYKIIPESNEGMEGQSLEAAKLASMGALHPEVESLVQQLGGDYNKVNSLLFEQERQRNPNFYQDYMDWEMYSPYSNLEDIKNGVVSSNASLSTTVEILTRLLASGVGNTNLIVNNSVSSYDTDR